MYEQQKKLTKENCEFSDIKEINMKLCLWRKKKHGTFWIGNIILEEWDCCEIWTEE
jgi:hypothetical protein